MSDPKRDPIEGFQITDYDPVTKKLTISIHSAILQRQDQEGALSVKAIEIIEGGPGVDAIEFVPR